MPDREYERGTVWGLTYDGVAGHKPVVIVSNDARNSSRFEWVHVVRITSRDKPRLATIVPLSTGDAPIVGNAMCDEVEMVPKDDLEHIPDYAHTLSPATMRRISAALTIVLDLD